ncbi:MAG: Ger(x)C family spore germination protein [Tepidanaerobacteraceae bacterium]
MNRYKKLLICILSSMLLLVGCWDMVEIDRRLFVGIVGIDTSDEPNKYTFYFSIPIAREIIGGEGGGGGGGGESVGLLTTEAYSLVDAARNLALRINRDIYFEHMRIVVIGEDMARKHLKAILNPFARQPEFNRRSRIAICEGRAEKVMGVTPWTEKLKAEYMESLYAARAMSGKFIEMDLGDFFRNLNSQNGNILVSKITPNKTEVNIGGAGVIKDFKLIGWLNEEETQGVNFFLGKVRGGDIVVRDIRGEGTETFTILGEKTKLSLKAAEPVPEFLLEVYVTGNIASTAHYITYYRSKLESKDIERMEELISKEIESQILKGVKKLQEDYKVDLLKLGNFLQKHEPALWKTYEDNWEEIFTQVNIDINVSTTIKNIGILR